MPQCPAGDFNIQSLCLRVVTHSDHSRAVITGSGKRSWDAAVGRPSLYGDKIKLCVDGTWFAVTQDTVRQPHEMSSLFTEAREHASIQTMLASVSTGFRHIASYHNWLTLNFTAFDSSSDERCFLKELIVLIWDSWQAAYINNSVRKRIFPNIQSKSFLEQFLSMSPSITLI